MSYLFDGRDDGGAPGELGDHRFESFCQFSRRSVPHEFRGFESSFEVFEDHNKSTHSPKTSQSQFILGHFSAVFCSLRFNL